MTFGRYFDHTLLKADATKEEIERVCREAIQYHFASVCVGSARTNLVSCMLADVDIAVCTVVGFPLGSMSTMAKKTEALMAIEDGATEIDMVINVGAVKDGDWKLVRQDIEEVAEVCEGNTMGRRVLLKVILETCLLTEEEKLEACRAAVDAGADFVKTSTGFSTGGATPADVSLMRAAVDRRVAELEQETGEPHKRVQVKASGGIRTLSAAKEMLAAGADRLGTSATVAIVEEEESEHQK